MSGRRRTLLCSHLAWVTCIIYGMTNAYCIGGPEATWSDVLIYQFDRVFRIFFFINSGFANAENKIEDAKIDFSGNPRFRGQFPSLM